MARGGNPNPITSSGVSPEEAPASWEPDPEYAALGAQSEAAQRLAEKLQNEIAEMVADKGVDPELVVTDKPAMVRRLQGVVQLKRSGYDFSQLQRRVLVTGKSAFYKVEDGEDTLVATEDQQGNLVMLDGMTSNMFG